MAAIDKRLYSVPDEPFAVGYLDCASDCKALKIASGMLRAASELPLVLRPEHGFAGFHNFGVYETANLGVYYSFGSGIICKNAILLKKRDEQKEFHAQYEFLERFFDQECTANRIVRSRSEHETALVKNHTLWGGVWGGHANIDHGSFIRMGTDGVREKIRKYRPLHPEKSEWYDALETAMQALDVLGERYRVLAVREAEKAQGDTKRKYLRIAKALETVPRKPAVDFFSACQSFYLVFTFDGKDSPGSFDEYMYDFYKTCDKAEAREILEGLWDAFRDLRAWNLCIGGSYADFSDRTNALSYEILDVTRSKGYHTPNLTLRWHRNTPDDFLREAARCIATGIGLPALYNDEAVCPALEKVHGIPPEDSHLYAMNGCNQIDIQGKSYMGLEDGEVFLLKCLEYALFDGVCQVTGRQLGLPTGDARRFTQYDDLWEAYCAQVRYAAEVTVRLSNTSQMIFAEHAPNPLRSCLLQGCIESGRDYSDGGPIYNHGQILTEGLADTADSLTAIRHFVYDTGEISMDELLEALKNDFEGKEALRLKLLRYEAKFGNDNDEADRTAREVQKSFFELLTSHHTWRGRDSKGNYGGGLSTFSRTASYGADAGANANGRHSRDVLIADSIGATPGFDRLGPTAALCSALKYDHSLATSGFVMQLKFDKKWFNTPQGIENFMTLVKAYFMGGGQQLSVNVLDAEELIRAKENPEHYSNLIVRVGGYSDYFTKLSPGLQDNIIARTMQKI